MSARALQLLFVLGLFAGLIFAISYSFDVPEIEEAKEIEETKVDAVSVVDRSGMILLKNDRSDTDDYPFILEAKLSVETSDKLIFDVKYFMSDTIDGSFNISIHPDMGDWSYSSNTLRSGMNTEKITVSFRGEKSPKVQSYLMHIYINKHEDRKYMGKVFDRTVDFPKEWAKPE